MNIADGAGRCSAAIVPERADRLMTHDYSAGITAQAVVSGRKKTVELLEVIGHERSLVSPKRLEETLWSAALYNTALYNTVSQTLPPSFCVDAFHDIRDLHSR